MTQFAASQNAKPFTFDTVFDGDQVITPNRPKRSFTPDEVEAVRTEAFASGERSVLAKAEQEAAAALGEVAKAVKEALAALTRVAHVHRTQAAGLALAAARKIADAALVALPEAPVAAALTALARELESVPRLYVHVGGPDSARHEAALTKAAADAGFAGQIIVKPDPNQAPAAFILDWGDGRAAFDPEEAAARVAAALEAALVAEGLHAEPLNLSDPEEG